MPIPSRMAGYGRLCVCLHVHVCIIMADCVMHVLTRVYSLSYRLHYTLPQVAMQKKYDVIDYSFSIGYGKCVMHC